MELAWEHANYGAGHHAIITRFSEQAGNSAGRIGKSAFSHVDVVLVQIWGVCDLKRSKLRGRLGLSGAVPEVPVGGDGVVYRGQETSYDHYYQQAEHGLLTPQLCRYQPCHDQTRTLREYIFKPISVRKIAGWWFYLNFRSFDGPRSFEEYRNKSYFSATYLWVCRQKTRMGWTYLDFC